MRRWTLALPFLMLACGTEGLDPQSLDAVGDPATEPETPAWVAEYQSGTVVEVAQGEVSGVEEDGLRVFRGIPFAAPPTGDLRLRDPQPAPAWNGTLDASEFGPACPQATVAVVDWLTQVDETDEDCLTLNIWAHDDGTAKPVMVWVHGGAFFYGAGSQDLYDGTALAQEDVVVVSVNYRLGALGFLAHRDLGTDVGNDNPGNFGLKDQVMALQWVRENIAAFGGDPDNVTLFGESAGGISTCILGATPAGQAVMDKAILQSAVGCHALPTATAPGGLAGQLPPLDYGDSLVEALGCGGAEDTLACLQAVPAAEFVGLVGATDLLTDSMNASFPMPYVDGSFVPEQPAAVYARGDADMPMIIGTTEHESTMFMATQAPLTWFGVDDEFEAFLGDAELTEATLEVYPIWDFPLPQDAFLTFATDVMFSCPSAAIAESAADGAPTFVYEFRDVQLATAVLGSHHALEIPYLFDTFGAMGVIPLPGDRELGQAMRTAWTSFARNGAPAPELGWTPYSEGEFMVLDDAYGMEGVENYRDGRCEALADLGLVGHP